MFEQMRKKVGVNVEGMKGCPVPHDLLTFCSIDLHEDSQDHFSREYIYFCHSAQIYKVKKTA